MPQVVADKEPDETVASYRRILRTSSITGGSSFITILVGLIKTKGLALLLGPSGIGLVSLYLGLINTASAVASLGVGTVGTRQVAKAAGEGNDHALATARRALFWGTLFLAGAGAFLVWVLRDLLALHVLGEARQAATVGWLALGVALSVAVASQGALIRGMRRIGDMARLSVFGSVSNAALGLGLIWRWGEAGLIAFVLTGPFVSFALGHFYVSRLPKPKSDPIALREMTVEWQTLLRLGIPFMGAGVVGSLVALWIRVSVDSTLGAASLGHFVASWTISMQYIGFVLAAMGADYYPRLTSVIHDPKSACRLVNEQTEIALLIGAPIFIAMIGLAPWVLKLLYSVEFMPAVEVLRWQVLGDVLKVASWPLGFVILAAGAGKTFFITESIVLVLMGGLVAAFLPIIGLEITGIAFLVCYVAYLPLVYLLAKRRLGFHWSKSAWALFTATVVLSIAAATTSTYYWWGPIAATVTSFLFGVYALSRLAQMSGLGGSLGRLAASFRRIASKFGL